MSVRVVAIGQRLAGDDGVGLSVLDRMRALGLPAGVDAHALDDASDLVSLIDGATRVVIVDAVLSVGAGRVVVVRPDDLDGLDAAAFSTHGIGVVQALGLAKALTPPARWPDVHLVGVTIRRPRRGEEGLSPDVAAVVDEAAQLALELSSPINGEL